MPVFLEILNILGKYIKKKSKMFFFLSYFYFVLCYFIRKSLIFDKVSLHILGNKITYKIMFVSAT